LSESEKKRKIEIYAKATEVGYPGRCIMQYRKIQEDLRPLVRNRILTAETPRTQRENVLFGGEPFDKLKALSKVEEMPPNKKASVLFGQDSW
jgi:hypothetical protein